MAEEVRLGWSLGVAVGMELADGSRSGGLAAVEADGPLLSIDSAVAVARVNLGTAAEGGSSIVGGVLFVGEEVERVTVEGGRRKRKHDVRYY